MGTNCSYEVEVYLVKSPKQLQWSMDSTSKGTRLLVTNEKRGMLKSGQGIRESMLEKT